MLVFTSCKYKREPWTEGHIANGQIYTTPYVDFEWLLSVIWWINVKLINIFFLISALTKVLHAVLIFALSSDLYFSSDLQDTLSVTSLWFTN